MQIVFRVDASSRIGTGHVMRCLTLADEWKASGAHCRFICREHPGNLIEQIRLRGFDAQGLPGAEYDQISAVSDESLPCHADWLGASWDRDAEQTQHVLGALPVDCLVVDHYALDARWELVLRPTCRRLMVIDDLADRRHDCDLLLDQNLGRDAQDYIRWVPTWCVVLAGPRYALLRPEFRALREYSLTRRDQPRLRELLITMGGVDLPNATGQVLEALRACSLPQDCRISVVMGPHAPWLSEVQALAAQLPWPTLVLVNVNNMAQLMTDCDLAIGAAGSTSWERCCLGVPTLMVVLADNQHDAARRLESARAAVVLELGEVLRPELISQLTLWQTQPQLLADMVRQSSAISDGQGTRRVLNNMTDILGDDRQ